MLTELTAAGERGRTVAGDNVGLPELLLAHLQREARDARELTSRSEHEHQNPSPFQQ
jgi:hypothetical protein